MSAILPRSSWTPTANGRAGRGLDPRRVRGFTFHWPATPGVIGAVPQSVVAGLLRTWRAQHIRQGWADIGYNYAIDQAGRVYFLTGLNRGAHAGGTGVGNTDSVGILMVIGMGEKPSAAMLSSAAWLTAHLSGSLPRAEAHWPHSHWTSTDCCGNALRSAIASGATRRRNLTTTPIPKEDDMPTLSEIGKAASDAVWGRMFQAVNAGTDYAMPAQTAAQRFRLVGDRASRALVLGRRNAAELAGLRAAVAELAKAGGVDPATIERVVRESTEAALQDVSITLSVAGDENASEA